ncbi:hypothetical protein L9F63_009755, partial [Diploptera punctata]
LRSGFPIFVCEFLLLWVFLSFLSSSLGILDRSCCGRSVRNKLGFLIEPAVKEGLCR